ncbi:hypothetical protein K505DRAFT_53085 [Melanomma pulvis-pyrius CBS 109.77]|uniref:Uncharacterized protein n=1 Tax=Melanomma pulvis-pyrius CBS 109.77 TaxID=1314802 RepID=A0A6A6X8A5_9PLEO|nr:hypothetical protein K505DRAFT_53085 [Melanomma pulvis-pyrius CBS 109.77]
MHGLDGWVGVSDGWIGRDAQRGAALGLDTVHNAMCAYSTFIAVLLVLVFVFGTTMLLFVLTSLTVK